jgi:hypothetical protein
MGISERDLCPSTLRALTSTRPDGCLIILGPGCDFAQHCHDVIEFGTLTEWEPEHDLPQDQREIISPARILEERGRGTTIRKDRDLQHILDHQAEWDSGT